MGAVTTTHHDDHRATLDPPRVEEVSEGLFAYIQPDGTWFINNTGFLVGRTGVVSIDACSTERRTRAYLDAIRGVTDRPVRTLVNTHHHGDHTYGNIFLRPAAILGHERCREEVIAGGGPVQGPIFAPVDFGAVEVEPPFITFTEGVDVYVDDLRVELRYVGGPAHTTNDVVAWVPERRVLYAGDLVFNGGMPFVVMGSVSGSLTALERLRELGAERIVPGHGDVCGPELFDFLEGFFRFVQDTAASGKAAGLSPLDLARQTDLGQYGELADSERIVGNLHRAYAELDGAAPGAPIDVRGALDDMITFNGGAPLRCLA